MMSAKRSKYNNNKLEVIIALLFQGESSFPIILIFIIGWKLTIINTQFT